MTARVSGGVMAGPASKENGGCSDCSGHGLLAYGAGSSIVVVDVRSMQLVLVLPMPAPRASALLPAPYVTALQWLPEGLSRSPMDEFPTPQLQLAAGDRQGRIAIWDVGSGQVTAWLGTESEKNRLGIQHVCWVHASPWLLAAIHGPCLAVIWDPSTRTSLWRYDAAGSGEILTCLRCDPYDPHQLCIVGFKGLLLSVFVGGTTENDILAKAYQVGENSDDRSVSATAAAPGERDKGLSSREGGGQLGVTSAPTSAGAPALASMPGTCARCMFSSGARNVLYVMFSREILVFDLQFGMTLSSVGLPRGCGKLLELVADVGGDILFCAHVDGRFSAWKRKQSSQVFTISHIDTLMPSIGTSVPPPSVLGVSFCPINLPTLSDGGRITPECQPQTMHPNEASAMSHHIAFVSISDDGRLWHWLMRYGPSAGPGILTSAPDTNISGEAVKLDKTRGSDAAELTFQLELTGQLHLLPASVTTLAVSVPSLLATVSGGGNAAATSVPLVALATQAGSIELVDPSANAVTSSFSVHSNNVVRGVRWLGNSRLVSFSYTEVKGKGGGFVNRLVVTCIRSGQSRCFRVLQKPERAPMRALRTSPSGRYMLILFREAPAEVWAMTKNPQMLRSLALPFTVMEWALPPAPKSPNPSQVSSVHRPSLAYRERPTIASTVAAANAAPSVGSPNDPVAISADTSHDEIAESFAFALVNGSLGVFELRGRRVRDFKPKWPISSFVSTDVLVTAMAYRMPHVVMGDRIGNLRWWDVTTGSSSWFNTHRGGIRRIKFAPVLPNDSTRGRVAILFNDNTFAIYDLDTQDPLANSIVQPQLAGILVLELDWFPLRTDRHDPLLLCVVGADSSFRVLEVQPNLRGSMAIVASWERQRPMPIYSPALLPSAQALALRMLLQVGVHPSWFGSSISAGYEKSKSLVENLGDLRHYLLETNLPSIGDPVVLEVLLKALEPYRKAGRLLDAQSIRRYSTLSNQGCAARLAFAAAHYGNYAEAIFWLQLPRALMLLSRGSAGPSAFWEDQSDVGEPQKSVSIENASDGEKTTTSQPTSVTSWSDMLQPSKQAGNANAAFPSDRAAVSAASQERISWHKKLGGDEAAQKLIHEYVAVGDFEAAVTLLLATPPDNPHFYVDALRAVSLAAAVSPGLHELAVKVVAANMVATDDSLSGTHLLCAVGRYQEACSQLQDAGRWEDACTLAASKLEGSELARVLERWAEHVLQNEHNIWKAMTLFVAAGALTEALLALNAQHPDVAAMFLLACHEAKALHRKVPSSSGSLDLPGNLACHLQDVTAVCEFYGQHQRRLAQLCSDTTFF